MGPGCSDGKLNSQSVAAINEAFGRSISLMDLISLLHRFLTNQLSDSELVQVIQMGSYFARNKLSFTLASANLDRWLIAGSLADPQIMKRDHIMNLDPIVDALCGKHYDAIVAGINSRLSAPAGTKFRRPRLRLPDPWANLSWSTRPKPAARRGHGNTLCGDRHAHEQQ